MTMAQRLEGDLRIILVGKTGAGKSATGNTILCREAFHREACAKSVTKSCQRAESRISGMNVTVVDTPGWCDTEQSEGEIVQEVVKCIDMTYPGPHVFLIVLAIGRFTNEESKTIQKIQDVFGTASIKYMMILFTRGDDLEGKNIDDYLQNSPQKLKRFVENCGDRYHVFNNRDKHNNTQVFTLLQKIQEMVKHNGGDCYTNTTYHLMEIYRKKEAEIQVKIQAVEKEIEIKQAEFLKTIARLLEGQEKQQERQLQLEERLAKCEQQQVLETTKLTTMLEQMTIHWTQEDIRRKQEELRQRQQLSEYERRLHEQQCKWQENQITFERKKQQEEKERLAEERLHRQRMEEQELKKKIAESQHQQKMEEERQNLEREHLNMLREHKAEIVKLQHQKDQAQAEKEKVMRENMKKRCLIA